MRIYLLALVIVLVPLISCQVQNDLPQELQHFSGQIPANIDFNFHVKPILSDRCFTCHGPDEENLEAGLRLDLRENAYGLLENHTNRSAIVPGNADRSELVSRILSHDPELMMPPLESKLSLSDQDRAILIRWINQGAEYKDHWSFQPVQPVKFKGGAHPVDQFVSAKIEEKGLSKTAIASRESLIRRVTFDLTGLPPSLEEIDQYVADQSPEAFEKVIDRLLTSPAYGERMAADWMDVARYADSDGYLDDKHREFSPWRDWVIKVFNENMPYDQFVTWQLAGDLIEEKTQESILATAFNRLHRKNSEAGIVFEEYRVEYVADRVNTFSKAFLGLTAECARCHDHKYDPISQKEYYQLFAFFNSTNELGTAVYGPQQTPGPALLLTNEEQSKVLNYIAEKIAGEEEFLSHIERDVKRDDLSHKIGVIDPVSIGKTYKKKLVAHHNFDHLGSGQDKKKLVPDLTKKSKPATIYQPKLGQGIVGDAFYVEDYNYVLLGDKVGWYDRHDPFSVSLWLKPGEKYSNAGIFSHCEDLRLGYKGYALHLQDNKLRFIMAFSWPTNAIEVVSESAISPNEWVHVAVTYDGSSRADGIRFFINGQFVNHTVVVDNLYKGILYKPDIHTYGFAGFRLGYRDKIKPFKNGAIDEVKIFNDELSALEVMFDHDLQSLEKALENQEGDSDLLQEYYHLNSDPYYQAMRDTLRVSRKALNQAIEGVDEIMVMGDLPEPRPTFLLKRGMYDAPGEAVAPDVPKALGADFSENTPNRLALARWLFDKKNPLTARVFVNRIWQQHFGLGLVSTAEDFGAQGAIPSHPELLDFLASYFMDSGWDTKALHKMILTSAAYQRSSEVDSLVLMADPENIWLARGPSQRLTAEMIRDNVLAISELLATKVGGVSVYPYQPAGLWDEISNKSWRYPYLQEPGEGLYRRSLYTIWKRTSPPPSMLLFDVPDRSFCTVQRRETSTPLQALVLLNAPQYIEACRELAQHIIQKHDDIRMRLEDTFRLIFSRRPTVPEMHQMEAFYLDERKLLEQGQVDIEGYLTNGERSVEQKTDKMDLVALATTAHNLLNTYEAQMKK